MKLLKIFGVAFGVIVTLAIVAAIALWLTFDPNDYKGYLADWVGERTGRELVIEDDLELTFFPWLGVTTGNIRLGNAPGFGEQPFASIDRTTVSVRLLPLLRRQLEIGTVRLEDNSIGGYTTLTFTPAQTLPGNRCVEVRVTGRVRDLAGTAARPQSFTFTTDTTTTIEDSRVENFNDTSQLDRARSAGDWNGGAACRSGFRPARTCQQGTDRRSPPVVRQRSRWP